MANNKEMQENFFPNKHMKKLQTLAAGYTDTIDAADVEEIKKRILTSEHNIYEIEHEKETNIKLLDAKEKLKEMSSPYSEAKGVETAKIKYCFYVLQSRNINL